MGTRRERIVSKAVREILLGCIAFAGAWIFLNHHLLYLQGGATPVAVPLASYALTTGVLFLFIKAFGAVSALKIPWLSVRADTCPECGQPIADATPESRKVPADAEPTPKTRRPVPTYARPVPGPRTLPTRPSRFESGVPRRVHVRRIAAGTSMPHPHAPHE